MALSTDDSGLLQPSHDAEILSDDQIDRLLQEAEFRLRQKAGLEVASTSDTQALLIPKLQHGLQRLVTLKDQGGVVKAESPSLALIEQKQQSTELRPIPTTTKTKTINDITDAGPQWFNLPKTELTSQLKRDLQMIELRNVLDPHRHYKKNTRREKVPTFSQVGTVIEGPTEFYSGRINKKDRSKNFVEEAMKTEAQNGRFKRKYAEIQDKKTSGKKAHYKKLMSKRKKS